MSTKEVKKHAGHAGRLLAVCIFTSLTLFTSLPRAQQKAPTFRARIDLMQLDVTVLDKKGQPVRGLTKDDFTLLEDDKPQAIEGFTSIDLPDAVHDGPAWSRDVTPDITTNEIDNHRIFVIVLDDARAGGVGWGRNQLMQTAEAFVDLLGPQDLAAIVYTEQVKLSQNLTNDRAKLVKAIRAFPLGGGVTGGRVYIQPNASIRTRNMPVPCNSDKEALRLLEAIVTHLATLPDRRKAIIYYGAMPWAELPTDDDCGTYWMWRDVFTVAQQGHVTINPVFLGGLTGKIPEHYLAVAENTGGHAVVQSNDLMPGIRQILVENSSYYLLAYQPVFENDGRFRRLSVKVNRPDVDVITRRGYWAPRPPAANKPPPEAPSPQVDALAGVLPASALNLRASAAPFAVPGTDRSVVALSLGLRQFAFAARTQENVDLLIKAFTPDGDERASETVAIPIAVPAAPRDADATRYDVLARIELPKPGRYELRLSATSTATNERGSVYVDVEVPDFRKAKVSLSGVVINSALPGAPVAPARAFADLTPLVPTTERTFTSGDVVTALVRVYQGGNDALAPVALKTTVLDAKGATVFDQTETLSPERFKDRRAADHQVRLPLAKLTAGEYLLTIEATVGKLIVKRDVRFRVE